MVLYFLIKFIFYVYFIIKNIYYIIMSTGNTKYGDGALNNNTTIAGINSAFGINTLRDNTNKWNTLVGAYAGLVNNGQSNTGIGANALLKNTSGNYNTALGTAAICFNIDGSSNTAVGSNAMADPTNTTGSENTALGTQAGYTNSGNKNTFLGANTESDLNTRSNSTAIGYGAQITASNQISIGTRSETMYIQGGFNMKVGDVITGSAVTLPLAPDTTLAQLYIINNGGVKIKITLPVPSILYKGAQIIFRRQGNRGDYEFTTASGGNYFYFVDANTAGPAPSMSSGAPLSVTTIVCDGNFWFWLYYFVA